MTALIIVAWSPEGSISLSCFADHAIAHLQVDLARIAASFSFSKLAVCHVFIALCERARSQLVALTSESGEAEGEGKGARQAGCFWWPPSRSHNGFLFFSFFSFLCFLIFSFLCFLIFFIFVFSIFFGFQTDREDY